MDQRAAVKPTPWTGLDPRRNTILALPYVQAHRSEKRKTLQCSSRSRESLPRGTVTTLPLHGRDEGTSARIVSETLEDAIRLHLASETKKHRENLWDQCLTTTLVRWGASPWLVGFFFFFPCHSSRVFLLQSRHFGHKRHLCASSGEVEKARDTVSSPSRKSQDGRNERFGHGPSLGTRAGPGQWGQAVDVFSMLNQSTAI
ncbi:hypothetical protein J3F83DRAFT_496690 [Trichoderma novae-zelandiae]